MYNFSVSSRFYNSVENVNGAVQLSHPLQEGFVSIRTFHLWVLETFTQTSGQDWARHDDIQMHPQAWAGEKSHWSEMNNLKCRA